jgi:hypothetical protein
MKSPVLRNDIAELKKLSKFMADELKNYPEDTWLITLANAILDNELQAYYQYHETTTINAIHSGGFPIEVPKKSGIIDPPASEFSASRKALLQIAARESSSQEVTERIKIKKDEFKKWLDFSCIPLPRFWYEEGDNHGRQATQIKYILELIEKEYPGKSLKIPNGGKARLKEICIRKNPSLFTASGFDHAWKAARKLEVIESEDHNIYTSKNKHLLADYKI